MIAWPWPRAAQAAGARQRRQLQALLAPQRGALEPPVRAELFGAAGFVQHGRALAMAHGLAARQPGYTSFFPRLRQNIAVLHEAHAGIAQQERNGRHVSPAGEWLLDNIHLVVAQTREVHDGLPRRYYRSLPVLSGTPLDGLPRVYAIAWAYVAHADSAFDPALLAAFLCAYQEVHPLTQGELWALPTTLRVVLVENLRRLAERVAAEEAARELAQGLGEEVGPGEGSAVLAQSWLDGLQVRGVARAFALQLAQRLNSEDAPLVRHKAWGDHAVRDLLARLLPEPAAAQAQQQIDQAADNLSVGNAIRSLQLLGSADWRGLIAQASALMQQLLTQPGFAAERDDTQDSSLHAIERLARRSGLGEAEVAGRLIGLMQSGAAGTDAADPAAAAASPAERATQAALQASPGHWLQGAGRPALLAALGLRPRFGGAALALRGRLALPLLLLVLGAGSLALTAAFLGLAAAPQPVVGGRPGPWLVWALAGLLALWPASEAVIAVVNRLVSESLPPRLLPRLALEDGIPPEHRVLVVLPSMLTDGASIQALAARLERHHLANREQHAQFALLTDFVDADQVSTDADGPLLSQALAAIDALNARHPAPLGQAQRFLLLHRQRRWSASELCWIGWERKRGKLEQLVASLATSVQPFLDFGPSAQVAADTPYIVTLDSDTLLPPGALRELVGIAAHPLNQPRLGRLPAGRSGQPGALRVVAGHGILQPRIVAAWPTPGQATGFHRLFAGASGSDPYNAAASEVYQDLFDEGSFSGKGLLHVAAMQAVLAGRLPDDQVLSHDLIEGCLVRCGAVSDVALIEPAPGHADVAAARTHRWTRGDWQLLPLLGQARALGLRGIDRWKLLDNLRRSLVAPAAGLLLLLSLMGGPLHLPVSPWAVLTLAALAFSAGPLVGAVAGLAPSRDDLALRHFARLALAELARALVGLAWQLALWWRQSLAAVDAIARALWRSAVSRRGLLQWTTAAAAEASAAQGLGPLLRRHAALSLSAGALAGALLASGTATPGLALSLCLLWAGTPLWIALASRAARAPASARLAEAEQAYLLSVARDTWDWFAENVGPQSHHLPPDNVQTVPRMLVAQRTSPTNIGLYLLALAAARAFGWVSPAEMAERLQATLDTLDGLARERGHFMNWIDIQTLQTLAPAYVSTVDSGNLCGHLLAVASACDEVQASLAGEAELQAVFGRLALRCRALAESAEFGFLYDRRRRLLHIGWRVAEQQLDAGHYDLLASEARLASLWAIAKGDLPPSHWAALGRPFQATGTGVGLRSWSGSMFEYLMPVLVLDEPEGSALASAGEMAVQEQRAWARQQGLPWGVSESAYAVTDRTLAYQYAPQGVPRLALRRSPPDERVVAPYATLLAAMLRPHAAVQNLRRLQSLHARGRWGFIEALDYTSDRQIEGSQHMPVSTFMAHHQGMALVALANVLLDGRPRRWCMSDARIAAMATLLQERVPREVARLRDAPPSMPRGQEAAGNARAAREVLPGAHALQRTALLSNGRYSVALRANGAGWSRLRGIDIGRWRDDALRDEYGHFLYLRRPGQALPVSLTQHPAPDPAAHYSARFHSDRVCLEARWTDLRSRCTVWVSPEDDIELRRIELWNETDQPLSLELLSAWEVCLGDARADEMHPAFANLFISADWDPQDRALYLARRPRREGEAAVQAVNFIAQADASLQAGSVRVQADRALWRGRLREAWAPLAQFDARHVDGSPAGTCSTGLDPVAALSWRITLPPHGTAQFTLGTAVAPERATLEALVDRFGQAAGVERSSQLSATLASLRQRDLYMPADVTVAVQTLATLLVLVHARPQHAPAPLPVEADPANPAGATGAAVQARRSGDIKTADGAADRRQLWRFGLSGDRPLLVVSLATLAGLRLVQTLVQGLLHWNRGGIACDLVLVNTEPASYLQPLHAQLRVVSERYASDAGADQPGRASGLCLLQARDLSAGERATLALLARAWLHADGRTLVEQVGDLVDWHDLALAQRDAQSGVPLGAGAGPSGGAAAAAAMATGSAAPAGSFDGASGAYRFEVSAARPTPRPWVNVLANPAFGALLSEAGAGCTWAGNSRLHQITPWSNDALTDQTGEGFWLQEVGNRAVWNLGAGIGCAAEPYQVTHGPGSSRLDHRRGDLAVQASWRVDPVLAVKRVHLRLHNHGPRGTTVRLVALLDWLLGAVRSDRQSVRTAMLTLAADATGPARIVLLATQLDGHDGAAGHTAFLSLRLDDAAEPQHGAREPHELLDWTCDRRELFDSRGRRVLPDHLGRQAGAGTDPCAALAVTLKLAAGGRAGCTFVLGHGASFQAAVALARQALAPPPEQVAEHAARHWPALLGAVSVRSPDPLFDAMVNHWLLYQATACRLWGRAGFYQAGGAYGFRDQLQDAMALATTAPQLLREHLLRAAARQFVEGDVQHWWHPHSGAGVRTRFSDDLLWLPHAALHYVASTGDASIWTEQVPFIEAEPLAPGAEDAYTVPRVSLQQGTLYEHCARTLDRSLGAGAHGLPLMGAGDWNDGMNRVGAEGRGESVWLAWFLCRLVDDFSPLAGQHADASRARRWRRAAAGWRQALLGPAWDGDWYRRAFFDDGTPLGAAERSECRIDLIAQSWSVLSGVAPPDRQAKAMDSAQRLLADPALGLVRLLDPPLVKAQPNAGYIQAYPPGVRENGAQYTHAAVWAAMAWAGLGDGDAAWRHWVACSPAHRAAHPVQGRLYGLEPYAVAADIYSQPPYAGRGGWSWYTGAAAWLHRAAVESICGLQVRAGRVRLRPVLPSHWPAVELTLRRDGRVHRFTVCAAGAAGQGARDAALAEGALPLAVGVWLQLADAGATSHHWVACAARPALPAALADAADVADVADGVKLRAAGTATGRA